MIILIVLVVVLVLGYLAFRRSGEAQVPRAEMIYRLVSPLPVLLVLVLPSPMASLIRPPSTTSATG